MIMAALGFKPSTYKLGAIVLQSNHDRAYEQGISAVGIVSLKICRAAMFFITNNYIYYKSNL